MATIVGMARRKAGSWEAFLNRVVKSIVLPNKPVLVWLISVVLVAATSAIFSLSQVQLEVLNLRSSDRHVHNIFVSRHNLISDIQGQLETQRRDLLINHYFGEVLLAA